MQKIDRIPAPAQRVRLGHWHSACQQQNPRTCVLRDREVGLIAQATSATVRGRGLHETSRPREHSCWHPSRPQPRSHPAPTLLRASDWSGAPLAAKPQARSRKSKLRGSKRRQTDDSFHPSLHFERIQTDALELAACDEARPVKVQKSFALPEPILCSGVPC